MSTFKVNYAGLGRAQKKPEPPLDPREPISTPNRSIAHNIMQPSSPGSKPQSPGKESDSDHLGIFKNNFHSGNLEYIDLLLKTKASSGRDQSQGNGKKKRPRAKSNIAEVTKNPPQAQPNSPEMVRKIAESRVLGQNFNENDKPESMRPDDDDGMSPVPGMERRKLEDGDLSDGDDTRRNLRNGGGKNEGKLFEQYFNEGVVRRSMSLEDLRVDRKVLNKDHNRSTFYNPGVEGGSYSESLHHDSKQSNAGPKDDFLANLGSYIDYFNKSDSVSYRSMKAGQYFHGNSGKSHRAMQRELEAAVHESKVLKMQLEKVKRKMSEYATLNKVLTKELKAISIRDEEQQQLLLKMREKAIYLAKKNQKYKSERAQLQEALRHERIDNEKNLFSLRQVLANINIALDQKGGPYGASMKEKHSHLKSTLADSLMSKKDREKTFRFNQKEKKRVNGTSDAYTSIFETGNHMRSRDPRMSPKREGSMMFSQKQMSASSGEEEGDEGFTNQFSNSNGFEDSYEGSQNLYQDSYLQEISKDNQIKLIQEKLAELMNSEEVSFNGQTTCPKSTTKTNRSKQPHHSKKGSTAGIPSYYLSKQGNLNKQAHLLAKYNQQEQLSRAKHNEYAETPSGNEMTDRSFSLHNSE